MIERTLAFGLMAVLAACDNRQAVGNVTGEVAANVAAPEAPAAPTTPAGPELIAYTSLKPEDCKLIEKKEEEAGYSRHRCGGIAGYALETSESDLRQDIIVIAPDGRRSELGLSGKVAMGAFNALGPTAEWRGTDRAAPSALIVRLGVASGAEPNRPDTSNLVVVKVPAPSCIVAVVPPGPGQNDRARDIADKLPGTCLVA